MPEQREVAPLLTEGGRATPGVMQFTGQGTAKGRQGPLDPGGRVDLPYKRKTLPINRNVKG